ncbi:MAG: hypothetical protein WBV28_11645 [Terracidiphilus sp.]
MGDLLDAPAGAQVTFDVEVGGVTEGSVVLLQDGKPLQTLTVPRKHNQSCTFLGPATDTAIGSAPTWWAVTKSFGSWGILSTSTGRVALEDGINEFARKTARST